MNLQKSAQEIEIYREVGQKMAQVKRYAFDLVQVGANALDVSRKIEKYIKEIKAFPCFKGYQGFPEAVCISVNEVMIHGIPKKEIIFQKNDLVKVDLGLLYKGFNIDSAFSKLLGNNKNDLRIIETARKALKAAIRILRAGVTVAQVEKVIFDQIKKAGFYTTKEFSGHGIGRNLHEEPAIFNIPFLFSQKQIVFQHGMVVCIEPMLMQDTEELEVLPDGWGIKSKSGKNTAHIEQTILVLENSAEVLSGELY